MVINNLLGNPIHLMKPNAAKRRNGSTKRRITNVTDTSQVVQSLIPTTEKVAVKKGTGKRRNTKRSDIIVTSQIEVDVTVMTLNEVIDVIIIDINTVIGVEVGADTSD